MARRWHEELIWTTSEDGGGLDGLLVQPEYPNGKPYLVWMHGLAGYFSEREKVLILRHLAERGYTSVIGNNRGHDIGASLAMPDRNCKLRGAFWDRIEESPHDVHGWISWCGEHGSPRVVLLGHSLGAVKVAYYQAQRNDPRVLALATASPPMRPIQEIASTVAVAEEMVIAGRGQDLLPWGSIPLDGGTLSAQTVVSMANCVPGVFASAGGKPPSIARVSCPLFVMFATNEERIGGAPELEVIRTNATSAASVTAFLLEGAGHNYIGFEQQVATALAQWMDTLL